MTVLDDYESEGEDGEEAKGRAVAFPKLIIPEHELGEVTSEHVRDLLRKARKQTEAIRKLRDNLMEAMCWEDTPEGDDFWSEIYRKLSLLRQRAAERGVGLAFQLRKKLADEKLANKTLADEAREEKEGG